MGRGSVNDLIIVFIGYETLFFINFFFIIFFKSLSGEALNF